ncbi:hypothetical protein OE88DRAFT_1790259 [Heliocybe sulcata]|uniref:Uncharacterized protein n=1 Tax=Heliocybe sulcata TaxID=5364 RepID=A0A5C3N9T2_9AGAM|nr:hypothetical protein OE88DRAFT_1790259 [Heliocybe sulcata]
MPAFTIYVDTPCRVGPYADFRPEPQVANVFNLQDLQTSTPPRHTGPVRFSTPTLDDSDMSLSPIKADNSWADLGFDDFLGKMRMARQEIDMSVAMEYGDEEDEVAEMVLTGDRRVEDISEVEADATELTDEDTYAADAGLRFDLEAELSGMLGDVMSLRGGVRAPRANALFLGLRGVLDQARRRGQAESADDGANEEGVLRSVDESLEMSIVESEGSEEDSRLSMIEEEDSRLSMIEESEEMHVMMADVTEVPVGETAGAATLGMIDEEFAKMMSGMWQERPETAVTRSGMPWAEVEVKGAWWQKDMGFEN